MTRTIAGLALVEREEEHGRVRLALVDHANGFSRDACALTIDPLELHDGAGGLVRVDGIGNVATLEAYRRRGLASELLEVAIERMRAGRAAGSLLYGIDGFYEPFGWRTCGDERWVACSTSPVGLAGGGRSPEGTEASVRRMRPDDLADIEALYRTIASRTVGAVERPTGGRAWSTLDPDEVLVVHAEDELVGWAWRGRGTTAHDIVTNDVAGAEAFVELQAVGVDAMWHVLGAALDWTRRERPDAKTIAVGAPDGHALRELVVAGHVDARFIDDHRHRGGAMLLPFSHDAARVGDGSYQFVPDRF